MSGRVFVVGSINVDLVVRGVRLPAPGETTTGGVFERHHGGKGANQAVAAARLGALTAFVGAVGGDRFGEEARAALVEAGVDTAGLITMPGEATGVALILVDDAGENLIGVASGANGRLTASHVVEAIERAGPLEGDIVLVSREIGPAVVRAALRTARSRGARTILNPAPSDGFVPGDLADIDLLTPNRGELEAIAGRPASSVEAVAARLVAAGLVREAIVVTLGRDGALVASAAGTWPVSAPTMTAVDTTGAGDAFNGALAAMLASGLGLGAAVERAVTAATLSTTVAGAREGMPTTAELESALARRP
ncbi:MAG: ribokinase [Candidatus Limnocylindrales bacterium]